MPNGVGAGCAKLEVVEDLVSQVHLRLPSMPIERLQLHSRPKGFHEAIVGAVTDRSHRGAILDTLVRLKKTQKPNCTA